MRQSHITGRPAARPWLAWTALPNSVKNPLHITCLLSLVCLLSTCAQLAATGGPQRPAPGLEAGSGFGLPSPASIKLAGYTDGDLLRLGKNYGASYPHNRVAAVANAAHFAPDWHKGGNNAGLAYATYEFLPDGYAGEETIRFTWSQPGASFVDAWVGLSNFSKGRWDWFPMPEAQGQESVLAVDFAKYVQPGDDRMLVVTLFTGIYAWTLGLVRLGVPPATTPWVHTWGGEAGLSGAGQMATDASGNVYVAGSTAAFGAGGNDVLYMKYSPDGTLLWSRTWGALGSDSVGPITLDGSGNVYLAGCSSSFSSDGSNALLLLKFDGTGRLLWQKTWERTGETLYAMSVGLDDQGNIYMAGDVTREKQYQGNPVSQDDPFVLKISAGGTPQWGRAWGGDHSDLPYGGCTDAAGNTYVSGFYWMYDGVNEQVFLLKYDASGDLDWQKTWGGDFSCQGAGVILDWSGNVYVAGQTYGSTQSAYDALLLKYSPTGDLLWQRAWGTDANEAANSIAMGPGGELYLAGTIYRADDLPDLLLMELDPSGSLIRAQRWGGSGRNEAWCALFVDALYVCGNAPQSSGVAFSDVALSPTDSIQGSGADMTDSSDVLSGTWKDVVGTLTDQAGTLDEPTGQEYNVLTMKVAPAT